MRFREGRELCQSHTITQYIIFLLLRSCWMALSHNLCTLKPYKFVISQFLCIRSPSTSSLDPLLMVSPVEIQVLTRPMIILSGLQLFSQAQYSWKNSFSHGCVTEVSHCQPGTPHSLRLHIVLSCDSCRQLTTCYLLLGQKYCDISGASLSSKASLIRSRIRVQVLVPIFPWQVSSLNRIILHFLKHKCS
jgi:hypothetical protein